MRSIRKISSIAVFLACVLFLYFYVRNNLSDFTKISEISVPYVLLIGCVCLAMLVVNGFFLKVLTVSFGINLHFFEYFSISIITSFGNIFLPMKGGSGFRAVYLKSRYGFDYSYFLSSLAANYLVVFGVTSVVALGSLTLFYMRSGAFIFPAAMVFLAVGAVTSWAAFFPPHTLGWIPSGWARERANQVLSGWHIMRKSRKTVTNLCSLTLLNLFLASAGTWLEFAAFHMKDPYGNGIGFLQATIFTAIGSLSFLVSITPAALGIKESLLMFSSRFLGITPAQALAVSLLDRSVNVVVLCLFFSFASIYINKKFKIKKVAEAVPEHIEPLTGMHREELTPQS
jgi:uncharacterized membrane protein YbhN (UPF0104 family)